MLPAENINFSPVYAVAPEFFGPVVELAVLAGFETLQRDGEPDLIVELIDLFDKDARSRVGVMRESLTKGNWPVVRREAHSLRGSSSNLGAFKLASICEEIEGIGSEHLLANSEALMSCLEHGLARALDVLLAERQRRLQSAP